MYRQELSNVEKIYKNYNLIISQLLLVDIVMIFIQSEFQNQEKFWLPKITSKYSKALINIAKAAMKKIDRIVIIFKGEFLSMTLITKNEPGLNPRRFLIFPLNNLINFSEGKNFNLIMF